MTRPMGDFGELQDLLNALCEESITPEQMGRLEQIILGDPEAEAFYVQYLSMYAHLARHFTREPVVPQRSLRQHLEVDTPAMTETQIQHDRGLSHPRTARRARLLLIASLAIGSLAAAVLLALLVPQKHLEGPSLGPETQVEPTDETVAVLAQTSGAEWEETGMPTHPGAPLPAGRLCLKHGIAQIEFYSGATVILEAPADFQLLSAKRAYCARGKLRVTVPPQAQGFTISSPTVELVDLGTEFGVQVDPVKKTDVHVFQGKVELYEAGTPGASSRRELTTGRGLRREESGAFRPLTPDADAFVTARQLAAQAQAEAKRRHEEWLQARAALAQNPDVLLYYVFQTDNAWNRILRDGVNAGEAPRDDVIVGSRWGEGRWPGKQGLEFKRVSDRVRFHVPGEFDSLTLVAWVRVDSLPNQYNSLMMADGWGEGAVHWHIRNNGQIGLGVRPDTSIHYIGAMDYAAPGVFTPQRLGQWVQLAVVYDAEAGFVTHYVDGRSQSRTPIRWVVPLRIGDAELGNWNIGRFRAKSPLRNFSGCMDEFMLFARALSEAEVQRLYDQGRPPS